MYIVRKQLSDFSAAHRLINGYEGKCAHLHGHNYIPTVEIGSKKLDEMGIVIDFNIIKKLFNEWLVQHWDHSTLVAAHDLPLLEFLTKNQQKHYIFPEGNNTTAEVMAEFLFQKFSFLLKSQYGHLSLLSVTLAETCQSAVTFRPINIFSEEY